MSDGLRYTLTDDMIEFVDKIAFEHSMLRVNTPQDDGYDPDFDTDYAHRRLGYRAEAAARLWFGREMPWTILCPESGLADFAGFIDVRARRKPHHQLYIQRINKSERAYLLVCAAEHPTYRIVSWCWGYEAKQDHYWRDYGNGRPTWFVPEGDPIMKPPAELLQIVSERALAATSSAVNI